MALSERDLEELRARAEHLDRLLLPGQTDEPVVRQPVHTAYVPADRFGGGTVGDWATTARIAVRDHGPPPAFPASTMELVLAKLVTEPIEDLRVDFEDGYGRRPDDEEDHHATAAGTVLRSGPPPFFGLRCKSLEPATVVRAARTVDLFLTALGPPPPGFVITIPKATSAAHADAAVLLCRQLEHAHGLAEGSLRFELQVETPQAVLGADGRCPLPEMIVRAHGRLAGFHYGTYDYSTALGVAPDYQSMEHPAADHAKSVMQVAVAGTGVQVSDGSTNVLPVGSSAEVHAAWELHARLVRRSLERGIHQGWDLHPAQLVTRYAATYQFFLDGLPQARRRLHDYLARRATGTLDEPATARAIARFLLRGMYCGALTRGDVRHSVEELEAL
ncbi:aldolase/citrate lyase family protein [Dactylosporangium fulvum]|uniref:Aldolase/citrate lyase family protein n=1 Tax=Dactylosporangium fulvum TaxID=53359 RepID=A0ABY5W603_9ACTN|nr:aldolase/citrate lyase family protein [Dactylosporangium fulvum]UWP84771.1 aldolase/citrate lyase family protein [Dactylosporangium fulvum]